MPKMHKNEHNIDESLVRKLLENQYPLWAHMKIQKVLSSGTDNALFRLGEEYVIRVPRIEWSPGAANAGIEKEYNWIPILARHLKTSVSEPVFKGAPDENFPWAWSIVRWNEGRNPDYEKENEYEILAGDLAAFLNELHTITPPHNAPLSRRGVSLVELNEETEMAIKALEEHINVLNLATLWKKLSNTCAWSNPPVWIHGDLLPGNILISNNRLSAVIDFADLGIGDPASDLIIAWSLLNAHSRKIFRNQLDHIDHDTWERGKGWALSIALIILPYYKNTNPVLTGVANRIIEQVLNDKE